MKEKLCMSSSLTRNAFPKLVAFIKRRTDNIKRKKLISRLFVGTV
jgi:hypothetical protein